VQTQIRRQDRKLNDAESLAILNKGEYGVLSMCTAGNEGYGVPLNYALWNNAVYFHCAVEGSKLDNIRKNNRVSFCVVGKTEVLPSKFGTKYESAMVFGKAAEVEGEEKREALMRLVEKYSPGFLQEGVQYINRLSDKTRIVKVLVEHLSGKSRKE
jgi:uncharacterized protein